MRVAFGGLDLVLAGDDKAETGDTFDTFVGRGHVETTDFMTAKWSELPYSLLAKISNRIINEVKGINRVVYDVSGKPPATIEWE